VAYKEIKAMFADLLIAIKNFDGFFRS